MHSAWPAAALLSKVHKVWRTYGISGVWRRGTAKAYRALTGARAARAEQRAWQIIVDSTKQGPVFFPRHDRPDVSIVVPVFNNVQLTARCLNSVLRELDSLACEVIVVDDASTDETPRYLASCSGLRVVRHERNQGFVASANDGAALARGKFIHFLNNDTIVTPGWLTALLRTFESRDRVAAVGSQLRSPNGRISEAGGLIWRDGQGMNYARGRKPSDPGVSFPREVDYCSAASLMVRADAFHAVGGFSKRYEPAYYEDVDLCFQLRERGLRVLYQPASVVIHLEGATCGTDTETGVKRYQPINQARFVERWSRELARHFPPDERLVERAARRIAGERTLLVMDSFLPFDDRSAGGRRLLFVMRLMRDLGWHVLFLSHDAGEYEPYASRVQRSGIELVRHGGNVAAAIRSLPVDIDVAWVSRPDVLERYLSVLRADTRAGIIYDTVDLHFARLARQEQVTGHKTQWEAMRNVELDLAQKADHVVVTSVAEQTVLRNADIESSVVPIIEPLVETRAAYGARHDILFLGNYTHAPNVDAARWLVSHIMPKVWERMPNVRLVLAGSDPTAGVERLAQERVVVPGFVHDLRQCFDSARVFAAPLRFGGGMKGKIVQSLAHGVPVVTSAIGAEGIGLVDGIDAFIRDDPDDFAGALMSLYNDESLWRHMSANGLKLAQNYSPAAVRPLVESALAVALEHNVIHVGVDVGLSAHSA